MPEHRDDSTPARRRRRRVPLVQPLQEFLRESTSSSWVLVAAVVAAVVWVNSPWGASYDRLWSTPLVLYIGDLTIGSDLAHVDITEKPEAMIDLDGRQFEVGGLKGQPDYGYLDPRWLDWIGFFRITPETADLVPVFPWLGVMLIGVLASAFDNGQFSLAPCAYC